MNNRVILVSVIARKIVGVIALREATYKEDAEDISENHATDCCEISRIFVHPQCRRLGIATRLLDQAEDRATDMGYSRLKVGV